MPIEIFNYFSEKFKFYEKTALAQKKILNVGEILILMWKMLNLNLTK